MLGIRGIQSQSISIKCPWPWCTIYDTLFGEDLAQDPVNLQRAKAGAYGLMRTYMRV
jgi:hypothetical protein